MKPLVKEIPLVIFVMDPELSKAKAHQLMKTVHALRRIGQIDLLRGEITQTEAISRMINKDADVVYLPWKYYFEWKNCDAKAGATRTDKPLIMGYFVDETDASRIGNHSEIYRLSLLDFGRLGPTQVALLTQSFVQPTQRTGIRPLVHSLSTVYTEKITQREGLGFRLDVLQGLDELKRQCWKERKGAIRDSVVALWEIFFEKGPGRSDFAMVTQKRPFLGSFDLTADDHCLAFKLQFTDRSWKQRNQIRNFWPWPFDFENPMYRLFRACDLVRVQTAVDTFEVEITACLFNGPAMPTTPMAMKSLIIEPVTSKHFIEQQGDLPCPERPELQRLPEIPKPPLSARTLEASLSVKERMLKDASTKLRNIRQELTLRDHLLMELRRNTPNHVVKVPKALDAEGLIDVLRDKIAALQQEIEILSQSPATEDSELHLAKMTGMEETWIQALKRMVSTLEQGRPKSKVRLPKAS